MRNGRKEAVCPLKGKDQQEEIPQQDQGNERVDQGSSNNAIGADIQNGQCKTAGTLSVLWSDRQYKGSEKLSDADKMAVV